MRGVARVGALLAALATRRVCSLLELAAQWGAQPGFLQAEVAAWLPLRERGRLAALWPRAVAAGLAAAQQQRQQQQQQQQQQQGHSRKKRRIS